MKCVELQDEVCASGPQERNWPSWMNTEESWENAGDETTDAQKELVTDTRTLGVRGLVVSSCRLDGLE